MRFMGWVSFSLLTAVGFIGQASFAADCVPQSEMQVIAQHFTQFANIANSDYCYDGSQTSGLIQAIEFMRKTQFSSSMPKSADELFSTTFASDWYTYFIGRINDFHVQDDCPKGVGAFVYFFGNTMFVCPMLLTDNFTALDRTSVMMHEARHIDGFPHIMCDRGARAGMNGACDKKMSDEGSYSVTVETYAQLGAYAPNLHPALRAYARSSAVIYADEAFEVPVVVNRKPQFLLLTTAREFYKINADGSTQLDRLGDSPALGHIIMRSRHMMLVPEDKTQTARFVFARNEGELKQSAGDLATEYNAQTPQQRADLVDMHIAAQWNVRVYHSRLQMMCDPSTSGTQDVSTNGLTPLTVIYPTGYDRSVPSAYLMMDNGSVMEFGCNAKQGYLKPSTLSFDQKFKRMYKMGNEVLGITADGRLFKIEGGRSTALQTSVDGRIFDLVPNEDYSFFDIAGS